MELLSGVRNRKMAHVDSYTMIGIITITSYDYYYYYD